MQEVIGVLLIISEVFYLNSISAWIKDWSYSHGNEDFEQVDFKELAKIFYVGKIYE
jgi:hypothetical protein